MLLEEAIEKLLDGDAVMFAGAGCSEGAINLSGRPFPKSGDFAKYLAERAGMTSVPSLEIAAEAFVNKNGSSTLIRELQNQFTAKTIADHHLNLGDMPWKHLYTTNYDNVLEEAYKQNSKNLIPITASDNPFTIPKNQPTCVHLNGFIQKLNIDKINTELKLTEASYLSVELANSPWVTNFREDMRFAGAVFFIGYSLLYDLDIKRILVNSPSLKKKCFFILGNTVDESTILRANMFGSVHKISVSEFCQIVQKKRGLYTPTSQTHLSTLSIKEHTPLKTRTRITDRAFSDLMLFGKGNQNLFFESLKHNQTYLLERKAQGQVFELIDQGNPVITLYSDLGNGKSLFLEGLRVRALEHGFRVFEAREHNEQAASELQEIARLSEKVLVTIEEYQHWLAEIQQFKQRTNGKAILVLTARTVTNDVVFDSLLNATGLQFIPEIPLDILDDTDIDWFIDAFDEYGLWGTQAAMQRADKFRLIKTLCRGQIHALLLKTLDSPDIGQRIRSLVDSLKMDREKYEILLGVCILTIINQIPSFDTLVDIFGTGVLSSTKFRRDPNVKQFLDFAQEAVLLKSPIVAQYILNRIFDPAYTVSVLSKMAIRTHTSAFTSKRYQTMFNSLMMFSNLQMVLPEEGKSGAVIRYYESIKNLSRCKSYPLFWLQYAIACLVIGDLFRSRRYFETAYSFADKRGFDTYQIDNHYARFLLIEAVEKLDSKAAMESFRQARTIVNRELKYERRRFTYRIAYHYQPFFDRFHSELSSNQTQEIATAARDVLEMMPTNQNPRFVHRYTRDCQKAMIYIIDKVQGLKTVEEDTTDKTSN